ncbi:MAG TPA: PilT/PilU family type 4a pilus ATPase [bacterium]|nr:PilT/PilU family type 4a pilus ATPase [bacterium]
MARSTTPWGTDLESEEWTGPDLADSRIVAWLRYGRTVGASDLHLKPGAPPNLRVTGALTPIEGAAVLTGQAISEMMGLLVGGKVSWSDFMLQRHELDVGLEPGGVGRLRVNALFDRGQPAVAIRLIPQTIPALDTLGLPAITTSLVRRQKGLWIFTGATGHGKTTTQAAILRAILNDRPRHVITLEDPIEYTHEHGGGLISQREVGWDTESFEQGIVSALREDPDVILVGEMRDLETIRQALRAAETGHLVLTTLHTVDASLVPDRIIDVFPATQQAQIRIQLSDVLMAVYAQQLVRTNRPAEEGEALDLSGRIAAVEVLLGPMAELYPARAMIRTPSAGTLYTLMEQSHRAGCQTMERALVELVEAGKLTEAAAREAAIRRDTFDRLMQAKGMA